MLIKKQGKVILTDEPKDKNGLRCFLCGRLASNIHHIVYGVGKRKICDKERLTVPLCYKCHWEIHHNHKKDRELKQIAQKVWLENNDFNRSKWYQLFYKFWD